MSGITYLPLELGEYTTNDLSQYLGMTVTVPSSKIGITSVLGFSTLCLVKAAAAITSGNAQALSWSASASRTVGAVAGASAQASIVAGFAYYSQANIVDASYFWVVRQGLVTATTAAAVAATKPLYQISTSGLDDTTPTFDIVIAYSLAAIGSATTGVVNAVLPPLA